MKNVKVTFNSIRQWKTKYQSPIRKSFVALLPDLYDLDAKLGIEALLRNPWSHSKAQYLHPDDSYEKAAAKTIDYELRHWFKQWVKENYDKIDALHIDPDKLYFELKTRIHITGDDHRIFHLHLHIYAPIDVGVFVYGYISYIVKGGTV